MQPVKSQVQGILCQGQVLRHKVVALGEHWLLHSWDQTGLLVQTSHMHTFNFSFFIIQVLEDTVRGVKGEEPGGSGLAEWLAQLQEGSTQIQKEGIRGIHLEEDFGHLIGPDLGAACICMQTVPSQNKIQCLVSGESWSKFFSIW